MNVLEDFACQIRPDQSIAIQRYQGSEEEVLIPSQIEGRPVKEILRYAFTMTEVTGIELSEGIEVIAPEAFAMSESLRRVSLPSTIREIGAGAFKSCELLREIEFPHGNDRYFTEAGVLYDRREQALVLCPPGLELESFVVPLGIKTISAAAFYLNRKLSRVSLPLSLEKIESEAFLFTRALPMIELPPTLREIGESCFLLGLEKRFVIYAFPGTPGYRYAEEHRIPVQPLYAIVTD